MLPRERCSTSHERPTSRCPTLPIMRTCSRCGEQNPERARFCLNCGEPLATAEPARLERKVATALFADLVGSTTLAEQEDPEVVQAVIGRAFDRLSEEIARYEGLLEKFMGDAILAVFGVPRAHEDDSTVPSAQPSRCRPCSRN